jgi:hypothetical protein
MYARTWLLLETHSLLTISVLVLAVFSYYKAVPWLRQLVAGTSM